MNTERLAALARSPLGRAAVASLGVFAVALLLRHTGVRPVWLAVTRAAMFLPVVVALEGAVLACDVLALRMLYGPARAQVPGPEWVRLGLLGYALGGLIPAGRPVAEGVKAAALAKYTGGARAAVAAAQLQGVLLVANGAISVPCALATYTMVGPSLVAAVIAFNALLTLGLGGAILLGGKHSRVGAWLARRSRRASAFGPEFDALMRNEPVLPWRALGFATGARVVQVVQYTVLLAAVGGRAGILRGLLAEGVNLFGALVGDLIPAQLGAIEANFTLSARALELTPGDALAMPLIAHVAQLLWIVVGSLVPLAWPAPPVAPRASTEAGA